jgi:flagellar biosynthetic protein FliR
VLELFRQLGIALNYTQEFLLVMLIITRIVAMIQLTPFLGGNIVPLEVKMGLSALLTVVMWPLARSVVDPGGVPMMALPFVMLMLKEVLVGFTIGFVNQHIFFVMNMAGRLIDTARGTSMSEVQDPHSKQRATPIGDMYSQLFLVIFVAIGGHHIFLRAFMYSFEALPVHLSPDWSDPRLSAWLEHMLYMAGEIWKIAVLLSAPAVAATFITDVVFGILNRVAPQLNAYFMAMPVKAFAGILVVFISMTAVTARMEDWTVWTLAQLEQMMTLFFLNPK